MIDRGMHICLNALEHVLIKCVISYVPQVQSELQVPGSFCDNKCHTSAAAVRLRQRPVRGPASDAAPILARDA